MFNSHNSYYVIFFFFLFVMFLIQLIMSSKEFYRRLTAFIPLSQAAGIFSSSSDIQFCYRSVMVCLDRKVVQYLRSPRFSCFGESLIDSCEYLYFDKFSRADFDIQFKYFVSFFNRCTLSQKNLVRQSYVISSLVELL